MRENAVKCYCRYENGEFVNRFVEPESGVGPDPVLPQLTLERYFLVFDHPFCKEFATFEALLLKGHPGAHARDSVERASADFLYDGF